MNTFLSGGLSLLVLSPALASPPTRAAYPLPGQAPVSVMPVAAVDTDSRSRIPLREVLRQPVDGIEDPGKLYRLSVEERQRLREQLRNQPHHFQLK
ncbi:MAG: hypothetical protein KGZ67_11860 [Hydrogenophaga sp.]|jgi:hypothetical protein|nr:hypothetical protein [Hydrogenophaga sp.]